MKTKTGRGAKTSRNSGRKVSAKKTLSRKTASKGNKGRLAVKKAQPRTRDLDELFEEELRDIYWVEKALQKAIPKMIRNASSEELVAGLEEHLEITREQAARVERVFEMMGKPARAKKCEAMEGLIKEGDEMMKETKKGEVRDAAIIASAQKIEHYEIAAYGTLCAFAKTLDMTDMITELKQSLEEEKEADRKLTMVAEGSVNEEAASGSES